MRTFERAVMIMFMVAGLGGMTMHGWPIGLMGISISTGDGLSELTYSLTFFSGMLGFYLLEIRDAILGTKEDS